MKRFIRSLLYFFPVAILIYIILVCLWGALLPQKYTRNLNYKVGSYGHMYSRIQEISDFKNIDILFLGSSHSYRGFDPRIFNKSGFKTFNLGSSSQTPIQSYVLLERYINLLSPKYVVLEVSPMSFNNDGVESSLDLIANSENDVLSLKMAFAINHVKTYNTLIFGYFRDFLNLNRDFTEHIKKGNDTYISGGYVEKEVLYYKQTKDVLLKRNCQWNEKQLDAFFEIVELVKRKKATLILVQAPVTSKFYEFSPCNEKFDSIMNDTGVYYDFNKLLNLNDTVFFYDRHHLNQRGVEVFNNEFIRIFNQDLL